MMTLGTSGTPSREISTSGTVLIVYCVCLYIHVRNNIKYTQRSEISISGTVLIVYCVCLYIHIWSNIKYAEGI